MSAEGSASLAEQIKVQGDLIRRLKEEKAEKDKVRIFFNNIIIGNQVNEKYISLRNHCLI